MNSQQVRLRVAKCNTISQMAPESTLNLLFGWRQQMQTNHFIDNFKLTSKPEYVLELTIGRNDEQTCWYTCFTRLNLRQCWDEWVQECHFRSQPRRHRATLAAQTNHNWKYSVHLKRDEDRYHIFIIIIICLSPFAIIVLIIITVVMIESISFANREI